MGIDQNEGLEEERYLFTVGCNSSKPKTIQHKNVIDRVPVRMELETGEEVSVISEVIIYKSMFANKQLFQSPVVLTVSTPTF